MWYQDFMDVFEFIKDEHPWSFFFINNMTKIMLVKFEKYWTDFSQIFGMLNVNQ